MKKTFTLYRLYFIVGFGLIIIFGVAALSEKMKTNHQISESISLSQKRKQAENVENNIKKNEIDKALIAWKQKQLDEYKYETNLDFISGNIITVNLEAKEKSIALISGVQSKMNTYNDSSIEPLIIRAKKGDKLIVQFKNSLTQESTVHWHGVRVPNDQDGVPGVTQEPVPAGGSYTYTFVVNDPGTFLFHPHKNHSEQIGRGLYGVLIVEDPKEPLYDKEFTRVLKDYRVGRDGSLTNDFGNMMDALHGGRLGNVMTINNIVNHSVTVNPGDTVRLRLANMSNARIYTLDLSPFDAKVIATDDGIINNPKKVTFLEMGPGERYDIELKIGRDLKNIEIIDKYFKNRFTLISTIKVVGNEITQQQKVITPIGDLPDRRNATYNMPDIVIDLGGMGVMGGDKGMMMGGERGWTINDGIFPKTNTPIKLKKGKMYIVRMVNNSRRDHPMHLHGDFFQVINVNGIKGEYVGWKDTVNVKPKSYVDVAIIPTNTGKRAFHCHILEHADLGMFTTVDVED